MNDDLKNPIQNLTANIFVFIIYFGGIIGQYLAGHWADKHDLRKLYLIFYAAIIPFAFLTSIVHEMMLVPVTMAMMFFSLGMQPIENSLIARLTPVRWRSTAYGLKFILGLAVGSSAVAAVGYIQSNFGFPKVFLLSSINAFIVSILIAVLWFVSRKISLRNHVEE